MPFQRALTVLASVLAAGLVLTVAGCGQITPLGPDPAATMPSPHHLRSPFVLRAMRVQQPTPPGGCPAGYVTLPAGNPGMCYRATGTPVTITSAAISGVSAFQPTVPAGQPAPPAQYQFVITLPTADAPALTAVTTTAHDAQGALAISVAGKTWAQPLVAGPFTGRQFQIILPSRDQALQIQHTLAASG